MAGRQGFPIDNGHNAIDSGSCSNLWPGEGRNEGFWKGEATGFNDDAVELVCPLEQMLHRGQKIILNCATEATISQFNKATIELLLWAKAATA